MQKVQQLRSKCPWLPSHFVGVDYRMVLVADMCMDELSRG